MDIVFAHSDDLVVPLLAEWLNFVDVVRLDMACALSHRERENLDRIFALPQTAFNNGKHLLNGFNLDSKRYVSWLLRRKVKLVEIDIAPNVIGEWRLIEKYISLCGPVVRSIDFNVYNSQLMSATMNSCSHLRKLSIDNAADIEKDCVLFSDTVETFYLAASGMMSNNISIQFPNLIDLTIVGSGVSDSVFMGILQHSPTLQRLQFDDAKGLSATSFASMGQFCRSLDRLFVYDMSFFSAYLRHILPFTPLLKELVLCYHEDELDEKDVFELVTSYCPVLTNLTLHNCTSEPRSIALTAFTALLTRCVHLHTLSFEACRFVTDDYLLAIASNATQINNLCLSECNVSKTGLAEVAKSCAKLERISFSSGTAYSTTDADKFLFREETTVEVTPVNDMFGGGFFHAGGGFPFSFGGGGFGFDGGGVDSESSGDEE